MKRATISAFLIFSLVLGAVGCNGAPGTQDPGATQNTQETEIISPYADPNDGVTKVLSIGNSFTVDTVEYVYKMAESAGVNNVLIGKAVIPGATVDTHALNASLDRANYEVAFSNDIGAWDFTLNRYLWEALEQENWDYIVIQQHSPEAGSSISYGQLNYLIEYIRQYTHPDTQIMFHMTWAYQYGCPQTAFSTFKYDQQIMYDAIVSTTQKKILTNENIVKVIPSGTAIQNARTSYLGDTLTMDDGFHLNYEQGRYTAALTFVASVLDIDPEQVSYVPAGVSLQDRLVAVESVKNALAAPYQVTASQLTEQDPDSPRYSKGQTIKFVELVADENGAGGLTFYYTADGKTLTPFAVPSTGQKGWMHTDGVLVYPVIVKEDNYGVAGTSAKEYVVMGLEMPQTGTVELFSWIALQGPEGEHGYRVKIALGDPENIVAQYENVGNTQNVVQSTYLLDVTQGQTLYMIYEPVVKKNNEWFGYTVSITYLDGYEQVQQNMG